VSSCLCAVLAVLSVFDYPARQARHEELKGRCVAAIKAGDRAAMEDVCRKGTELLPDDPTWAYNLACALSKGGKKTEALDALEQSIRLGFRDTEAISSDTDLRAIANEPRFEELIDLADRLRGKPLILGPLAAVPATGSAGQALILGGHNLAWNLEAGCFEARMNLSGVVAGGNSGDLYFNRDGGHSVLKAADFPGLTRVSLDADGRERGADLDFPNMSFPYPVFGNCSRAMVDGPLWRSLPRALMTSESRRLGLMQKFYLSNQVWVFPAVFDCPPAGTNGDVFASASPYWITTQGKSWSDQYCLRAALEISRSLKPDVKREVVARGLLAPTVQTILRKSLKGVDGEEDYLTPKAHPTAFPTNGLDMARLKKAAAGLERESIPPLAVIGGVAAGKTAAPAPYPEMTYASLCACAFVLRAPDDERTFAVSAAGGDEYAFAAVHDETGAAKVEKTAPNAARISLVRTKMSPTNRVDVAVFARRKGTGWGAPAFVSFAVVDPSAEYSDPVLTPRPPEEDGRKGK